MMEELKALSVVLTTATEKKHMALANPFSSVTGLCALCLATQLSLGHSDLSLWTASLHDF